MSVKCMHDLKYAQHALLPERRQRERTGSLARHRTLTDMAILLITVVILCFAVSSAQDVSSWKTCTVNGDAHYMTFDGALFDYQGVCRHLLVDVCNDTDLPRFQIFGRNEFRNSWTVVSWPFYVEIVFNGTTVRLQRTGTDNGVTVTVNRSVVTLPYTGSNFNVTNDNGMVFFHGPGDLMVRFDGIYQYQIYLKSAYNRTLCGVCGNFNFQAADDYRTSNGTYVSADPSGGKFIVDSWLDMTDPEYDPGYCPGPIPPPIPPPPGPCVAICEMVVDRCGLCGDVFGHVSIAFLETIRDQCYIDMYYSNCSMAGDFIWWWRSVVTVLTGSPQFAWPPLAHWCTVPEYGVCSVFGEAHYITFDQAQFDYQGDCKYTLVDVCGNTSLPNFTIYARNEDRNMTGAWVRYVEIVYSGIAVRMERNSTDNSVSVTENGVTVTVPVSTATYSVNVVDSIYIYRGPDALEVRFDGYYFIQVILNSTYRGLTCGACGNFNFFIVDDYEVWPNGTNVIGQPDPGKLIVDALVVHNDTENPGAICAAPPTQSVSIFSHEVCDEIVDTEWCLNYALNGINLPILKTMRIDCLILVNKNVFEYYIRRLIKFIRDHITLVYPGCPICPSGEFCDCDSTVFYRYTTQIGGGHNCTYYCDCCLGIGCVRPCPPFVHPKVPICVGYSDLATNRQGYCSAGGRMTYGP